MCWDSVFCYWVDALHTTELPTATCRGCFVLVVLGNGASGHSASWLWGMWSWLFLTQSRFKMVNDCVLLDLMLGIFPCGRKSDTKALVWDSWVLCLRSTGEPGVLEAEEPLRTCWSLGKSYLRPLGSFRSVRGQWDKDEINILFDSWLFLNYNKMDFPSQNTEFFSETLLPMWVSCWWVWRRHRNIPVNPCLKKAPTLEWSNQRERELTPLAPVKTTAKAEAAPPFLEGSVLDEIWERSKF